MTVGQVYIYYGVIVTWSKLRNLIPGIKPEDEDACYEYNGEKLGDVEMRQLTHDLEEKYKDFLPNDGPDCYFVVGLPIGNIEVTRYSAAREIELNVPLMLTASYEFQQKAKSDVLSIGGKPGYFYVTDDCHCCS